MSEQTVVDWSRVQRRLARLPELDAVSCNRIVQEIWDMLAPIRDRWCGCEEYPCAHTATETSHVATDYEPCQGGDELTEIHELYCVPFYEWRLAQDTLFGGSA